MGREVLAAQLGVHASKRAPAAGIMRSEAHAGIRADVGVYTGFTQHSEGILGALGTSPGQLLS